MKNIIKTLIIVFVGLIVGGNLAFAASSELVLAPNQASSTVGSQFNVAVSVNPNGNNVCVVKGTINFSNLSCQNITLANGLMAQTVPTCAATNFTVGIPKCVSANQNLFTISVKADSVGLAGISLANVKIIGAGVDVQSSVQSGNYQIESVVEEIIATTTESTSSEQIIVEEEQKQTENIESGLQVPSGVGEFSPVIEQKSSSTVPESASSTATTSTSTNKTGNFVATAMDGFASIPNKLTIGLVLAIITVIGGLILYRKKEDINGL